MTRHEYAGGAPWTTLTGAINNSVLTLAVTSGTGYPTGSVGPFVVVLDRGTAAEEKVLCDSRSGDTITVNASGRGYDGTAAQSHAAGAYVEHVLSAAKMDELDEYVNRAGTGDVTTPANGSKVSTIANNAVTTAKILDGAVTLPKLVDAAGTGHFLARATSGAGDWEDITSAQALALLALDSTDLSDFTEAVQDLLGAQVGLGSTGLTFTYDDAGNAVSLVVNVDGVTLEISSDAISIKDLGVSTGKLAASAVTTAKLADANVTRAKLEAALPQGNLGWAELTSPAPSGYINGVTSDISPLSVTTGVLAAGRLLRASIVVPAVNSDTAGSVLEVMVREGATQLGSALFKVSDISNADTGGLVSVLIRPSAAAHTYKVSATVASATGTMGINASATRPMQFFVDDIGAA